MEKFTCLHKTMFGFILAGLAFSGYLAGVKFFTSTCAFGVSCPTFLGHPACYTGFLTYAALTIVMIVALAKKEMCKGLLAATTGLALWGTLFSGYLTATELPILFHSGLIAYIKSLPLCSIGFLFFLCIFVITIMVGVKENKKVAATPEQK